MAADYSDALFDADRYEGDLVTAGGAHARTATEDDLFDDHEFELETIIDDPDFDTNPTEEIELIAEPAEDTPEEREAKAAAFFAAMAGNFGGKKGGFKDKFKKKSAKPEPVGRHSARPTGAHAAPAAAAYEGGMYYEEPEVDRSNIQMQPARGRHAVAGAAFVDAPPKAPKPKKERKPLASPGKRALKIAGGVTGALLTVALGLYGGGVYYYSKHIMPGTDIHGFDASNATPEQVCAYIDTQVKDYSCAIEGDDYYLLVKAADIDFSADSAALAQLAIDENPKWLWPFKMKETRVYDMDGFCSWSNSKLTSLVDAYTDVHNAGVHVAEDAYVTFYDEADRFVVMKEIEGKQYHADLVVEECFNPLSAMEPTAALSLYSLVRPGFFEDDELLNSQAADCNGFLGANFDIVVVANDFWTKGERVLDHVGNATLAQWIHLDDEGKAYFDLEAMQQWCEDYARGHYTYQSNHVFTRPDGVEIDALARPRGVYWETNTYRSTYGWNYDVSAFYDALETAIRLDKQGRVELPNCKQTAAVWTTLDEGMDFGNTYIDITISTQIVRYYVDGEEVWQAPTVSGDINTGQCTPLGTFYITSYMTRNTHLKGIDIDGETPYDVPVAYWMPFVNNIVGLHDNPNRTIFGWPWAFRDAGSHGCVNLPYGKAAALYEMVGPGTCVVVHW